MSVDLLTTSKKERPMTIEIDHIGLSVSDFDAAKKFYTAALAPLRMSVIMEFGKDVTGDEPVAGLGADGKPFLWISGGGKTSPHTHVAIRAESRAQVDAFYKAAIAAGGKDNGRPASARCITRTTTAPSCSTPTATTSRPAAITRNRARQRRREETTMSETEVRITGGCQCGAVRYALHDAPTEPAHLPLPHVPEGVRLVLRAARRRAARQVRVDARASSPVSAAPSRSSAASAATAARR